ncbi:N-6 DNA methylase (plasmid) [Entomospira entomophila]|uniref:site-specific DNA-methyltransferase (adenine-specific) n=1 Tax=Entomospira entomophila TaxID=2719988 RepID=A0A968KWX5_9SPIO|nr:type ISP restriction/modification enzyme [Entomospira entomophilus]NIZ41265.1 N-6 DNA methylase [Entomospira entomophilus]WDI36207.1 N-6 DNA methylase [Entomospira entomophilus]
MKYEENIHQLVSEREDHERRNLTKETSIRGAFHTFLQAVLAINKRYQLTIEESEKTKNNHQIYYDATIQKNGIRLGIIENKDASDDLEKELASKQASGYDLSNAILENGHEAWLIRDGEVVAKALYFASNHPKNKKYYQATADLTGFSALIDAFLTNTSEADAHYHQALTKFEEEVPYWANQLSNRIDEEITSNRAFKQELYGYYEELKVAISEYLTLEDVKEVLIQHIMTIDLFEEIVGSNTFRRNNAIAKIMDKLVDALDPVMARNISKKVRDSYKPLNKSIGNLGDDVSYKVDVLKSFYQTFYHAYNTDDRDKLGIIYTPTEIIHFMVNASNIMLKEFFGKRIFDQGVNILDPCTGTGSFIVMLMQYIYENGGKASLPHKFKNELWANELSILAYYIAIIHIELVYEELTSEFSFFEHLVYADTLANKYAIQQADDGRAIASTIFDANTEQLEKQNSKTIQLIIGNPPYRANQKSGNENKQNNKYDYVDQRIKETYVEKNNKEVSIKLKMYDMYTRFIRWASDRIGEEGMLAVITNRNYLDASGFNGFRASVAEEFSHIYVVDLGGDVRKGDMSGNVFNIMTGVAIAFFIKSNAKPASEGIYYLNPFSDKDDASSKLEWLFNRRNEHILKSLVWQPIIPNEKNFWLDQSNAFDDLIALGNRANKNKDEVQSLFYIYSLGISTNRDSWMYDINKERLAKKVGYFLEVYHQFMRTLSDSDLKDKEEIKLKFPTTIKYHRKLINNLARGDKRVDFIFESKRIISSLYRPFTKKCYYYQEILSEEVGQMPKIFPTGQAGENLMICVRAQTNHFSTLITNSLVDLHLFKYGNDQAQCFPLYRYNLESGEKVSNINPTYKAKFESQGPLTDEQMFAYIYAMLHHKGYRTKYEIDLKQNLPSVPVSPQVSDYVRLGQQLIDLHLHYEQAELYPMDRLESDPKLYEIKLKSKPELGQIIIDTQTTLSGIPSQAWQYKLGNKSAIDWVLEGYSEKKNIYKDKANGAIADSDSDLYTQYGYELYNFADYKEELIDLVGKVVSVSLQTLNLLDAIEQLPLE